MIIVHGPSGGINWNYTSTFLKNNFTDFVHWNRTGQIPRAPQDIWHDFGAGAEPTFTCPECKRFLPLAIGEVDHITPKSTLTASVDRNLLYTITKLGNKYSFPPQGTVMAIDLSAPAPTLKNFVVRADGCLYLSVSNANRAAMPGRNLVVAFYSTGTPLSVVVRNDVDNLQVMCSYCNRSKGDR